MSSRFRRRSSRPSASLKDSLRADTAGARVGAARAPVDLGARSANQQLAEQAALGSDE